MVSEFLFLVGGKSFSLDRMRSANFYRGTGKQSSFLQLLRVLAVAVQHVWDLATGFIYFVLEMETFRGSKDHFPLQALIRKHFFVLV